MASMAAKSSSKESKGDSGVAVYKKGSFVCFVNGVDKKDDAKWDKFCIGKVSVVPSTKQLVG